MNMFYQLKNSFVIIPINLMLFFIYKKFIVKEKEKRIISDTIIVGILLILTVTLYSAPIVSNVSSYNRTF